MTSETLTHEQHDIEMEQAWRPDDYPPLATNIGVGSSSGAAGEAFSLVTPEHVVQVARMRARIASQERLLQKLLGELEHMQDAQASTNPLSSAESMPKSRRSLVDWVRSHFTA